MNPVAPPTPQEVERKLSIHAAPLPPMPIPPARSPSSKRTNQRSSSSQLSSSQITYQTTFSSESDSDTSALQSQSQSSPPQASHHALPSFSEAGSTLGVITERRKGAGTDTEDEEDAGEASEGEVDEGGLRDEAVVKSGYLYKKGERRKTWKKRWFVLRPGKLAYYKTSAEYRLLHLLHTSSISQVTTVQLKKYGHAFALITASRTFYMRAETDREAMEWIKALREVARDAHEGEAEEMERASSTGHHPAPSGPPPVQINHTPFSPPLVISSDSDDHSPSRDPRQSLPPISTSPSVGGLSNALSGGGPVSPVSRARDPNKPILQGYMTKMGKRKTWRKRWFVLRETGLAYGKSHMDTKQTRVIPMKDILHAIEYAPPDPKGHHGHHHQSIIPHSPPQPSTSPAEQHALPPDAHVFKVITAQRTFLMCAPSEDEEIKWLSALRACIARKRGNEGEQEEAETPRRT